MAKVKENEKPAKEIKLLIQFISSFIFIQRLPELANKNKNIL